MHKPLPVSALAGAFSFLSFYVSASGLLPSNLLLHFFPVALLFAPAFLYGKRGVDIACSVAAAASILSGSLNLAALFIPTVAFPGWLAGTLTTKHTSAPGPTPWYPVSKVVVWLSLYAASLVLWFSLLYAGAGNSFQTTLDQTVQDTLKQFSEAGLPVMPEMGPMLTYLIPIAQGWMWVLFFWFGAWFTFFLLKSYRLGIRSEFSIRFFLIPNWLLMVIGGAAGVSLLLTGEAQYVALIMTFILLLPYFLLGIMYIHSLTRPWPARWLVLTFVYLLLFKLWPILLVAILGIILHAHSIGRHWFTPGGSA